MVQLYQDAAEYWFRFIVRAHTVHADEDKMACNKQVWKNSDYTHKSELKKYGKNRHQFRISGKQGPASHN